MFFLILFQNVISPPPRCVCTGVTKPVRPRPASPQPSLMENLELMMTVDLSVGEEALLGLSVLKSIEVRDADSHCTI